ncbi:MAG: 50S ribosomal protein L25/general stress protein Ctc [Candidatus Thiodiazotropha sp. (ex Epidulcina cf. delphinae)]|nr:50S ribosomal protein L25/general stress protein Ctc [Candidatus Thiodiazotropha sp. (ex Epidulcina cf. delphinae)]
MSANYEVNAQMRGDTGKGASRRLRRSGLIPGILYGARKESMPISVQHHELVHSLDTEGFYSSLLTLKIDGKAETVVLKDLQRHPAKPFLLHVDFQRVQADEKIRLHVPIHFINEATCPGIKSGGQASHVMTGMEISCLPKDLPESIEVDMSNLELGAILHTSEVQLPAGVELITHEGNEDPIVVTIHTTHISADEAHEGESAEEGEEDVG